jgi:hypothetical protein
MKEELRWVALHLYWMFIYAGAFVFLATVGVLAAKYIKWLWGAL